MYKDVYKALSSESKGRFTPESRDSALRCVIATQYSVMHIVFTLYVMEHCIFAAAPPAASF